MTVQAKLSLTLLGGLLALLPLSQGWQYHRAQQAIRDLGSSSAALLQEREYQNVANIFHALDFAVDDSLARGEMGIYEKIGELRRDIPGLLEFSLYDPHGKLSAYSDKTANHQALPDALKAGLYTKPDSVTRTNADSLEVFEPQVVTKSCLECHSDWKENSICGVTYFRFSTAAVDRMRAQFETAGTAAKVRGRVEAALVLGVLTLVIGLLICLVSRNLTRTLHRLAGILHAQSGQVRRTAGGLTASSQAVADCARQQAAALEETRVVLEQVRGMIQRNADGAQKANVLAAQTRSAADGGAGEVQAMSQAMDDIKSSSTDIAKIIKTIDEIAYQTNILALNAAVEAARAGEAGMGFSVVADEVRNLAQRSAQAAHETADKIADSIRKSENGVQISERVAQNLIAIVERIRRVSDHIAEIATASQEQNQGIQQVNSAVMRMDQMMQTNAANAEESARASETLNVQAQNLNHAVAGLLQMVGTRAPVLPSPAAAPSSRPKTQRGAETSLPPAAHGGDGPAPSPIAELHPSAPHCWGGALPFLKTPPQDASAN